MALAADTPTVSTVSALEGIVDAVWTNGSMAKVMPPGDFAWNNSLGVIACEAGFDTNFLAALEPESNATFTLYPVQVIETNTSPRLRYYLNLTNGVAHTALVSIANYPEDWIEDVYDDPPDWLSGGTLTQWYTDRDPRRQHIRFDLISTSDVPAYIAMLTNSVGSWSGGGTNINLCEFYSNDIAFVAIRTGSAGMDVYLHAPTNVPTLDLFQSTNLLETFGWTLPATLDRVTDPIRWTSASSEPVVFFDTGNATVDTDGDGMADIREIRLHGTSRYLADSDGDGLSDGLEVMTYGLNPLNTDSDGDGIPDGDEVNGGTNPNSADSDGDGISDYDEIYTYFGRVDPMDADSDNDGLNDYSEIVSHNTYAAPVCSVAQDTDNDGLSDYAEVNTYGTDPRRSDSDNDGIDDAYEIAFDWDPLDAETATEDADNDGFDNLTEYQWCTSPTSANTVPYQQRLITIGPGSNELRRIETINDVLAAGDLADVSARVRIRPLREGTNNVPQRLHHTQTPGIYINGTEASSVATPIEVPAQSTAVEYRITADPAAAGTNIYFQLTDTNDYVGVNCAARFYVPKLTKVNFWGPGSANNVDVNYSQTNTLWIGMPAQTNTCRVRMQPYQYPAHTYLSTPYLNWTDWLLVKVTGGGADPTSATLNTLDWRSAYGVWNNDIATRGIRLDPGSYTFEVGFDMNGNGTLETAEVQETCMVHVLKVESVDVHFSDTNTYKIASVLTNGMDHFVCVKDTGDIILDAAITPTNAANAITWEANGATITSPAVGNDKSTAKMPSATSQKIPVRIKVGSYTCWSGTVWVAWSTVTATKVNGPTINRGIVVPDAGPPGAGTAVRASWSFNASITPSSLVFDADHPDLGGAPSSYVPNWNANHAVDNAPFGQPSYKWDISRQMRIRALSPTVATTNYDGVAGTVYDSLPSASRIVPTTPAAGGDSYPSDEREGNDDGGNTYEDDNPYDASNAGDLTDTDTPSMPTLVDSAGSIGDTIEWRVQFREFVRIELDGTWYRASDFALWRMNARLKKASESADNQDYNTDGDMNDALWIDDGSASDATNTGW